MFGSEIAYEDIEKVHLADYTYNLLREEKLDGRDVWVLESKPTDKRRGKTSYSRSLIWVDKPTYLALKTELYDKQGKLGKTYFSRSIVQHNKIWMAEKMIVVNHREGRMSMLKMVNIKMDQPMDESWFSSRILEDGNFREMQLSKLR